MLQAICDSIDPLKHGVSRLSSPLVVVAFNHHERRGTRMREKKEGEGAERQQLCQHISYLYHQRERQRKKRVHVLSCSKKLVRQVFFLLLLFSIIIIMFFVMIIRNLSPASSGIEAENLLLLVQVS